VRQVLCPVLVGRAGHIAVRDAIADPGTTILDVRSEAEYRGERFWPPAAWNQAVCGSLAPGMAAGSAMGRVALLPHPYRVMP
jgi:3-mercaptopyruvate sulfurtransferase SseA